MDINETRIFQTVQGDLRMCSLDMSVEEIQIFVAAVFKAMAAMLGQEKSKEKPVAIAIRDDRGNFLVGAGVKYHAPTEQDMPGNLSFINTFNEADLDGYDIIDSTDMYFTRFLGNIVWKDFGGYTFTNPDKHLPIMWTHCINAIRDWLDKNTEIGEVEYPGYFLASVRIENGVKVLGITPGENTKRLIKGDDSIQAA